MAQHNETGNKGEQIARDFIEHSGFTVLHTNWRAGRNEVDIIALRKEILHFIEVKTKNGNGIGLPEQRVNPAKLSRMKQAASDYLLENPDVKSIQFDIISIRLIKNERPEIYLIEDVF